MPWFGYSHNVTDVAVGLAQLRAHPGVIDGVAFMRYTVATNGSLAYYNVYPELLPGLKALGVKRFALVSTPRAPNITNASGYVADLEALFASPGPFLDAMKQDAVTAELDGINFDFEDETFLNATLARAYTSFLLAADAALRPAGLPVSVDVNFERCGEPCRALADSPLAVVTMDTYKPSENGFLAALENATRVFSRAQLVVGLETWPNFTSLDVHLRFDALAARSVCHAALWRLPFPDGAWWPFLAAFAANASVCRAR